VKINNATLTPLAGQGIPGASMSNSFHNIQKMNNRLKARNHPVLMSVQANSSGGGSPTNQQAAQLMPLSNRNLSPNSYQQLQNINQQQQMNAMHPSNSGPSNQ
jgi:hypothetical protein